MFLTSGGGGGLDDRGSGNEDDHDNDDLSSIKNTYQQYGHLTTSISERTCCTWSAIRIMETDSKLFEISILLREI